MKLSTPNAAVAGESGQHPLIVFRKIQILKYWVKIVSGPRDIYMFIMYQYLKINVNVNALVQYKNWALEIRRILIAKEGEIMRFDIQLTDQLTTGICTNGQWIIYKCNDCN